MGVSKLYKPQGSGLRREKGGLEGGVQGGGSAEMTESPAMQPEAAGGAGSGRRDWICVSETLSCATFIRTGPALEQVRGKPLHVLQVRSPCLEKKKKKPKPSLS